MLLYKSSQCCCIYVSSYYDICVLFSCCGDEERSIRRRDSIGAFCSPAAVMRSAASDAATAKVLSCRDSKGTFVPVLSCCGDEERSVRHRDNKGAFVPQAAVHFGRRYVVDSLRVVTPPAHSCSKVSSKNAVLVAATPLTAVSSYLSIYVSS